MFTASSTLTECDFDRQLEKQRKVCEIALSAIEKNGEKVAIFLRDKVTYRKPERKHASLNFTPKP